MSDPLVFLPYALAARGGAVNGIPAAQLVAAGLTLLQRSAPLVRSLMGRRSAVLLPPGPEWIVALAASEGHGALVLEPDFSADTIAHCCESANVGAVFTTSALASRAPLQVTTILLDAMPRSATVLADGMRSDIDLGSHIGLELSGARDVDGSSDECVVIVTNAGSDNQQFERISHYALLLEARRRRQAHAFELTDHGLSSIGWTSVADFTTACVAPLLAGAQVTTDERMLTPPSAATPQSAIVRRVAPTNRDAGTSVG